MTHDEAISIVESAPSPAALFPDLEGAKALYRKLAKACHPDRDRRGDGDPDHARRAQLAFAKLSNFYAQRTGAADRTKRLGDWTILGGLAKGSLCDVFETARNDTSAIIKIVRQPRDGGLLTQEAAVLKMFNKKDGELIGAGFLRYIPRWLASMSVGDRRANVLSRAEGCHTLESIRSQIAAPLDFRHVVWMGNRILELLGAIHRAGVIHGAILPQHLMYRPDDHGLILIDWTCSVQAAKGGKIPLISKRWVSHYPPEVALKRPTFSTDIYMAGQALRYAAGHERNIPRRFRAVLDWMTAESPSARPGDAWEVQDRWKDVAKQEYGEVKFVELKLPTN